MSKVRKLVGNSCYLTPVDESEAERVAAWSNDLEMSIKTGDASDMINVETQREYLKAMNEDNNYGFYIVDIMTGEVVGISRLKSVDFINRNAELGMFIGETSNRHRGIGTEAAKLTLYYAFNILNLRNIIAEVFSFNEPSLKLCRKCCFKEIGRRRSSIIYGRKEYDLVYLDILNDEFDMEK